MNASKIPLVFFELLVFIFGTSSVMVMFMEKNQTDPYMDEIFHIPQTQKYCQSQFSEWDPKITTPPGLYFTSFLILKFGVQIAKVDIEVVCVSFWLRMVNVVFASLNFVTIYLLLREFRKSLGDVNVNSQRIPYEAFTITVLPVLFFFSMFFYTDQGSLFFVLVTFLCHFRGHRIYSFLFAIIAISFRQTNVIWMACVLGLELEKRLSVAMQKKDVDSNSFAVLPFLIKNVLFVLRSIVATVVESMQLTLVLILFAGFVFINEGIVLGDKSAHSSLLHLPQLFYYFAFCGVLSAPHAIAPSRIKAFFLSVFGCWRRMIGYFMLWAFIVASVHFFTYEHPYLLADNRHYTFYVWRRIFRRDVRIKYLVTPVYLYCFHYWWNSLSCSFLNKLNLLLCTALCLIPSPLLEFRYFIVPFVFWRLQSEIRGYATIFTEVAIFAAINVVTLYIFFFKTFTWESEPNVVQRFMW